MRRRSVVCSITSDIDLPLLQEVCSHWLGFPRLSLFITCDFYGTEPHALLVAHFQRCPLAQGTHHRFLWLKACKTMPAIKALIHRWQPGEGQCGAIGWSVGGQQFKIVL